jgi:DNA polymerase-3 subunit gamma/tau
VTTQVLQQGWDGVLQALAGRRRVAWMVVRTAAVVSLDEAVLTLRFPRAGEAKGFSSSGYEALLKEVIHERFAINVVIRTVTGGDAAPGEGRRGSPGPGGPPASPAGPGSSGGYQGQSAAVQPTAAPSGELPPGAGQAGATPPRALPSGTVQSSAVPGPAGAAQSGGLAGPGQAGAAAGAMGQYPAGARPGPGQPGGHDPARATPAAAPSPGSGASAAMPHNGIGKTSNHVSFEDDVPFPPDDPYGDELAGSVDVDAASQLTGISLIQRDLGAQIIAEYEE